MGELVGDEAVCTSPLRLVEVHGDGAAFEVANNLVYAGANFANAGLVEGAQGRPSFHTGLVERTKPCVCLHKDGGVLARQIVVRVDHTYDSREPNQRLNTRRG